jgi:hypothetical protein
MFVREAAEDVLNWLWRSNASNARPMDIAIFSPAGQRHRRG